MDAKIWKTPFSTVEWLFCEAVFSDGCDNVEVMLTEHFASEEVHIAESDDPVEQVLDGSRPIEEAWHSRKWKVTFAPAIGIRILRDGFEPDYGDIDISEVDIPKHRVRSIVIEDSPWVAELGSGGLLDAMYPDCRHYNIRTIHSDIEVVAWGDPVIESLSKPKGHLARIFARLTRPPGRW